MIYHSAVGLGLGLLSLTVAALNLELRELHGSQMRLYGPRDLNSLLHLRQMRVLVLLRE
jgi:hypothetical protein